MARISSSSFIGLIPRAVVRGAPIIKQWLVSAFGDTALTYDRITGENGGTPIDHSGGGNGCSLGMPIAAQEIQADLEVSAGTSHDTYVIAVPFYVSAGEASRRWLLEVEMSPMPADVDDPTYEIRSLSWAVEHSDRLGGITRNNQPEALRDLFSAFIDELSEGWHYLLVRRDLIVGDASTRYLHGWRMRPLGQPGAQASGGISLPADQGGVADDFDAHAALTPGNWVDLYESEADTISGAPVATMPINAYKLSRLILNQNTLWEWLTASRIPGNDTMQTSTIRLADRATFAGEAVIDMPLWSLALGGLLIDPVGKSPGTHLTGGWHRYPTTQTGTLSIAKTRCTLPTTQAGKMRARVLCQRYDTATMGNWQFRVANATTGTNSSWATLSQLGSSDYWIADIADVPFVSTAGGALNTLTLQAQNTAGGGLTDEMAVGGWAMAIVD